MDISNNTTGKHLEQTKGHDQGDVSNLAAAGWQHDDVKVAGAKDKKKGAGDSTSEHKPKSEAEKVALLAQGKSVHLTAHELKDIIAKNDHGSHDHKLHIDKVKIVKGHHESNAQESDKKDDFSCSIKDGALVVEIDPEQLRASAKRKAEAQHTLDALKIQCAAKKIPFVPDDGLMAIINEAEPVPQLKLTGADLHLPPRAMPSPTMPSLPNVELSRTSTPMNPGTGMMSQSYTGGGGDVPNQSNLSPQGSGSDNVSGANLANSSNPYLNQYRDQQGMKLAGLHPHAETNTKILNGVLADYFTGNSNNIHDGDLRSVNCNLNGYDRHAVLMAFKAAMTATMIQESSGNEKANGDGGHSIGAMQLHDGAAEGHGMSVAEREKPRANFERALTGFVDVWNHMSQQEKIKVLEQDPTALGHFAAQAQRPADQALYAKSVASLLHDSSVVALVNTTATIA